MHQDNAFLTLTIDDEHMPPDGGLQKQHLQKFFKRLRKNHGSFRYYACGEYGDTTQRAHYHVCLFGRTFHDQVHFRRIGEHNLYISEALNKVWGLGHCTIGALTFETAAYTARYVTKKLHGQQNRYQYLDPETGELKPLQQPFAVMSLRSAIGREWLLKYHADIYASNKDAVVLRGQRLRPPKYYDKIFDTINPTKLKTIKEKRQQQHVEISNGELRAREIITRARQIRRQQI